MNALGLLDEVDNASQATVPADVSPFVGDSQPSEEQPQSPEPSLSDEIPPPTEAAPIPAPSTTSGFKAASIGSQVAGRDPMFRTCRDAKANGYGPYQEGVDPEYKWYDDRDHDGWVCE